MEAFKYGTRFNHQPRHHIANSSWYATTAAEWQLASMRNFEWHSDAGIADCTEFTSWRKSDRIADEAEESMSRYVGIFRA